MVVYIMYTITYTCTGLGPDTYSVGVLPERMVAYLEGMWTWKMGAKGLVGLSSAGMIPIFEYWNAYSIRSKLVLAYSRIEAQKEEKESLGLTDVYILQR